MKARSLTLACDLSILITEYARGACRERDYPELGRPLAKETLDRRPGDVRRWILLRVVRDPEG